MRCGDVHLTYCSNIHPAHGWPQIRTMLREHVPRVKAEICPDAPFAIGLRLAADAATQLCEQPDALDELRAILSEEDLYVFTLNGFPYGPFHGEPVKAAVYRPDWRHPARERYTQQLARLLAAILPVDMRGSISTVPGCFGPDADPDAAQAIGAALRRQIVGLVKLRRAVGADIALALEPEPSCMLETIAQTIEFFHAHLLCGPAVHEIASELAESPAVAEEAIRHHLGVCLDTCHAAVEFEDPVGCVQALRGAGIRIAKVQATTGLRVAPVDDEAVAALRRFADDVYLHQVVARRGDALVRHVDLPEAFAARAAGDRDDEWRVHFHVPVFLREPSPFTNTQDFLAAALPAAIDGGCTQVEVETYTWDVLPPEHRTASVHAAIARELSWTQEHLP